MVIYMVHLNDLVYLVFIVIYMAHLPGNHGDVYGTSSLPDVHSDLYGTSAW